MLVTSRRNNSSVLPAVAVMVPTTRHGGSGEVHAIVFQGKAAKKIHGFVCLIRGDVPKSFAAGTGHLLSNDQRSDVCVDVCGCKCIGE